MSRELLNNKEMERAITRMAHEIIERNKGNRQICFVGIQQVECTSLPRLSAKNKGYRRWTSCRSLDISLYRDDVE